MGAAITRAGTDPCLYLHVSLPIKACGLHAIPPAPCQGNSECPRSRRPPGDRQGFHVEIYLDAEEPLQLVDQIGQAFEVGPLQEIVDVDISRAERPPGLFAAKKPIDVVL